MNRIAALVLAALGLGPFVWAGLTSGDWAVARLTLIDPLVVLLACAAIAWLAHARSLALLRAAYERLMRVPEWILLTSAALWIVISASVVAHLAFGGQPAMTDELSQAFQGRILESGRLSAVPEQHPEFFETSQTTRYGGRWYAQYPIGSGLLAALGHITGLPWLIYPVIMALGAIAVYNFAKRTYGTPTARIALLLTALSPFVIFMSASRMNHVPTLALAALAMWAVGEWEERARAWVSAAGIGVALGAMVLFRPYDALLVAIPVAIHQVAVVARRRELAPSLVAQIAAGSIIAGVQLWVNARTTGVPLLFGYDALNGAAHQPGFHTNPLGLPFTPADGVIRASLYLTRLNTALFESVVPALVFIAGALWLTPKLSRCDRLLIGIILAVLAGYGIYWFDGVFVGPRFLFTAVGAFTILAARFVVLTAAKAQQRRAALAGTLLLPVCLLIAFLPLEWIGISTGVWLRLEQMQRNPAATAPDPAVEAKAAGLTNALVFVREPLHARLTARLRALGTSPFDAERTVADLDACALLRALDRADARPNESVAQRRLAVFTEARAAGKAVPVRGLYGAAALSLVGGVPSNYQCHREIELDAEGVEAYERFLAGATIDSTGRLGGEVVFARFLGARDSVLRADPRFSGRTWYLYRRAPASTGGRFEPYPSK